MRPGKRARVHPTSAPLAKPPPAGRVELHRPPDVRFAAVNPSAETVQGLWIGPALSPIEQLSIRSFLDHGHPYRLFSYDAIEGVPDGVERVDAATVLPRSRVFTQATGANRGSLAPFSDLFRYRYLAEAGGWWADLDVVCLAPLRLDAPYVFGREHHRWGEQVNSAILKVPPRSELARDCLARIEACDLETAEFGETGPRLLDERVRAHGLSAHVLSPRVFYPVDPGRARDLLDPRRSIDLEGSLAVHLWNEMWRRGGWSKTGTYHADTLFERLKARHGVHSSPEPCPSPPSGKPFSHRAWRAIRRSLRTLVGRGRRRGGG